MKNTILTLEAHAAIDRAIILRLLDGPATAGTLSYEADLKAGPIHGYAFFRHVDRWLQRNRKSGLVSFVREGRSPSWSLTPAGVEHYTAAMRAAEVAR